MYVAILLVFVALELLSKIDTDDTNEAVMHPLISLEKRRLDLL